MNRSRQQGAALILLLAILALGAGWFAVRRLNEIQGDFTAADRARNAAALIRAKQALIGYVAAQASKAGENNPGALPCPEAPGYYNSSTGNDGKTASSCTLPAVGRFPWRTIGTEQLIDSSGEPLWYVVSPGWAYTSSSTTINSNSLGQLSVDGVAGTDGDTVVALVIAPGLAIQVPASANCAAWNQTRPTSGAPDLRNYLECQNATVGGTAFVTTGPSGSFNDQMVRITKADVMPGIEAAIANRIQREIVPVLKTVYTAPNWGLTGSSVLYPFAAPFGDPSASSMQGNATTCASGTCGGLLPLNYAETSPGSGTLCTAGAGAPRCRPSFVAWNTGGISVVQTAGTATITSYDCTASTGSQLSCSITYARTCNIGKDQSCDATISITINAAANNVGMAMRQVVSDLTTRVSASLSSPTLQAPIAASGAASASVGGSLSTVSCIATTHVSGTIYTCTVSNTVVVTVPITVFADHPILDPTNSTYGWFLRNKWHELTYYAVATNYSPTVMPTQPNCTTGTNCLSVTNVTVAGAQRAILILAGRAIDGSTRPSATLGNYLEFGNATGAFERQTVSVAVAPALKRPFNDRIVVLDSN